jgi:hypothetical protein
MRRFLLAVACFAVFGSNLAMANGGTNMHEMASQLVARAALQQCRSHHQAAAVRGTIVIRGRARVGGQADIGR